MSDLNRRRPERVAEGNDLFTKGDCMTPTAVYRSQANDKKSVSNVILFFHGWHVVSIEKNVFGPDTDKGENKLRESVDAAGKDVVLIVPFLGHDGRKRRISWAGQSQEERH